ncbi:MAG: Wzz/FepE/Etk N-terminal domain-containing protein [Sediminibacterium sp.]
MVDQNNIQQMDNDEISLKELIQKIREWYLFLLTKWKLIVLAGIIGGLIGFTYAYFQKPTYKAVLTFALEEEKSGGGGLSSALGLASSLGIDLGSSAGGAFSGANLIELMKSRKLIEKTLLSPISINGKTQSLADYYLEFNEVKKNWDEKPLLKGIQFPVDADRTQFSLQQDSILKNIATGLVKSDVAVSQKDKKISIISIEVNSTNEVFAKTFCETLAFETSEYYIEIKSKKARMNVEILQHQTDSIRAELNSAITGVAAAADNVFNLNMAMNVKRTPGARRQVDVQANTAMLTSLVTNLEMSKMALRKETPLIQVIDKPIFPLEKEKVGKLKSLVLGGFLAGFLTVLYLVFSSLYKKIVA